MLKRKLRSVGSSMVITIPQQLCEMNDFNVNDIFSVETIGRDQIILKKVIENV